MYSGVLQTLIESQQTTQADIIQTRPVFKQHPRARLPYFLLSVCRGQITFSVALKLSPRVPCFSGVAMIVAERLEPVLDQRRLGGAWGGLARAGRA